MERSLFLLISICFVLAFIPLESEAQYRGKRKKIKHRFNAGIIAGGNISQVDGDLYTGFDKAGLRGGLKGSAYLNDRLDLVVGFLFNQKGSRFEGPRGYGDARQKSRAIHFDYVEVPLLLNIQLGDEPQERKGYNLEAGFSYARMINYEITEIVYDPEEVVNYTAYADDFSPNEYNIILGGNYMFNRHIGIGFHYTLQMNKVFENPQEPDRSIRGLFVDDPVTKVRLLRNYQMAFQIVYNIF